MKDNFSLQSPEYAHFRPSYPDELFQFIYGLLPGKLNAWDCGTGNGQVAFKLSEVFEKVYATDISSNQVKNAIKKPNILYSLQPAEKTSFPANLFDLITIGQAMHWFNFKEFYAEVRRTARKDAIIAVIGYSLIHINPSLDKVIGELYSDILGNHWDRERKYIDEKYETIPFPFDEIKTPHFENTQVWSFDHFVGYLNTWSAVQHYIKAKGANPIGLITSELKAAWGDVPEKKVNFPILLRIGRI